jgi:hypothetical protein
MRRAGTISGSLQREASGEEREKLEEEGEEDTPPPPSFLVGKGSTDATIASL